MIFHAIPASRKASKGLAISHQNFRQPLCRLEQALMFLGWCGQHLWASPEAQAHIESIRSVVWWNSGSKCSSLCSACDALLISHLDDFPIGKWFIALSRSCHSGHTLYTLLHRPSQNSSGWPKRPRKQKSWEQKTEKQRCHQLPYRLITITNSFGNAWQSLILKWHWGWIAHTKGSLAKKKDGMRPCHQTWSDLLVYQNISLVDVPNSAWGKPMTLMGQTWSRGGVMHCDLQNQIEWMSYVLCLVRFGVLDWHSKGWKSAWPENNAPPLRQVEPGTKALEPSRNAGIE